MIRAHQISTLFPYTTLFRSLTMQTLVEFDESSGKVTTRRRILFDDLVLEESDRKSTRLNSSHGSISYAVFCLKKKRSVCCGHITEIFTDLRRVANAPLSIRQ